jgi:hypothetical protein
MDINGHQPTSSTAMLWCRPCICLPQHLAETAGRIEAISRTRGRLSMGTRLQRQGMKPWWIVPRAMYHSAKRFLLELPHCRLLEILACFQPSNGCNWRVSLTRWSQSLKRVLQEFNLQSPHIDIEVIEVRSWLWFCADKRSSLYSREAPAK